MYPEICQNINAYVTLIVFVTDKWEQYLYLLVDLYLDWYNVLLKIKTFVRNNDEIVDRLENLKYYRLVFCITEIIERGLKNLTHYDHQILKHIQHLHFNLLTIDRFAVFNGLDASARVSRFSRNNNNLNVKRELLISSADCIKDIKKFCKQRWTYSEIDTESTPSAPSPIPTRWSCIIS